MSLKPLSLGLLLLVGVSAYTYPTLPAPDVSLKEIRQGRKLLDDKARAQLALWSAVNRGDLEGMREAKEQGADPEAKTYPSGYRPIHLAASIGNVNVIALLMEFGVDVNAKSVNGTTPLHYTANHGDSASTEALLVGHANPNIADNRGFAPLHFASFANMLQFKGYNSMMADGGYKAITTETSTEVYKTSDMTSKTTTVGFGDFYGCARLLLAYNADASAATSVKETPLHYTPAFDSFKITELLIDKGANVNAADGEKEVPLHEATAYGALGVTQLLLTHGGDASAKEEHGLTPEDFICRCNMYKNDPSLTQCAPAKCSSGMDTRVLKHVFNVYRNKD